MHNNDKPQSAFSRLELLVGIAVLGLLVLLQLPAWAVTKAGSQRLTCSDNLKRVSLAFRNWSANHNGRMPMTESAAQGGASSTVGITADGSTWAANYPASGARGVFGIFAVMSNELSTPKILYCPAESAGTIFPGEIFGNSTATNAGFYSDSGTSYFVGVDAIESNPAMLLAGDHNLGVGAEQSIHVNRFVSAGTNANWVPTTAIGWQNNQHRQQGNVAFLDGSVQNFTTPQFRQALNQSNDRGRPAGVFANATGSLGFGINRLQMPKYQ